MELSKLAIFKLRKGNELEKSLYELIEQRITTSEFNASLKKVFGAFIQVDDSAEFAFYLNETLTISTVDGPFEIWGIAKALNTYWKYHELFGIENYGADSKDYFYYLQIGASPEGDMFFLSLDTGEVFCKKKRALSEMEGYDTQEILSQVFREPHFAVSKWLTFMQLCTAKGLDKLSIEQLHQEGELLGEIAGEIFNNKSEITSFFQQSCFDVWEDKEQIIDKIYTTAKPLIKARGEVQ